MTTPAVARWRRASHTEITMTNTQAVTIFTGGIILFSFGISVVNQFAEQQTRINDLRAQLVEVRAAQTETATALPAFKKDLGALLLKMDAHNSETGALASMAYTYSRGEKGYELCSPVCTQGTICEQAANAFRASGECDARPAAAKKSILAQLVDGDFR